MQIAIRIVALIYFSRTTLLSSALLRQLKFNAILGPERCDWEGTINTIVSLRFLNRAKFTPALTTPALKE